MKSWGSQDQIIIHYMHLERLNYTSGGAAIVQDNEDSLSVITDSRSYNFAESVEQNHSWRGTEKRSTFQSQPASQCTKYHTDLHASSHLQMNVLPSGVRGGNAADSCSDPGSILVDRKIKVICFCIACVAHVRKAGERND